jgi:hypothetical protein
MKKLYTFIAMVFFVGMYEFTKGQATLTLQPDSVTGKDALIFMLTNDLSVANFNDGNNSSFEALAWSWSGDPGVMRSLLQFDLSSIPVGSVIQNATLSLYNNPYSSEASGQHQSLSGSNASVLQKITAAWNENTVTWNNQPPTTIVNQVTLAQSTSIHQDYTSIDITGMVTDWVANPSSNYGFMFKLVNENYYRSMIFASSDNVYPALRPKLVVQYSAVSVNELTNNNMFEVYPNPSDGNFTIGFNNPIKGNTQIEIKNSLGKKIFEKKMNGNSPNDFEINLNNQAKGIYVVSCFIDNTIYVKKLEIQ